MPSGASTGIYEALELRDNDKTRYMGKGKNPSLRLQTLRAYYFPTFNVSTTPRWLPPVLISDPFLLSGVKRAVKYINEFLAPALCNQVITA